ncbi:hypothetical protein C8F01DRAFT_463050 [Mycena amicta]|nr:hypothetical protein C8F01DRAFT_463050 [Mycena amicta]
MGYICCDVRVSSLAFFLPSLPLTSMSVTVLPILYHNCNSHRVRDLGNSYIPSEVDGDQLPLRTGYDWGCRFRSQDVRAVPPAFVPLVISGLQSLISLGCPSRIPRNRLRKARYDGDNGVCATNPLFANSFSYPNIYSPLPLPLPPSLPHSLQYQSDLTRFYRYSILPSLGTSRSEECHCPILFFVFSFLVTELPTTTYGPRPALRRRHSTVANSKQVSTYNSTIHFGFGIHKRREGGGGGSICCVLWFGGVNVCKEELEEWGRVVEDN